MQQSTLATTSWFGAASAGKHDNNQTLRLFCQLSNKLVGRLCVPNTKQNLEWLAAELHRQAFLCVKQDGSLPSAFLNVYVGQHKVQDCTSLSDLSRQKVTYMWDYEKHEKCTTSMARRCCTYRDNTITCFGALFDEVIAVASCAHTIRMMNPYAMRLMNSCPNVASLLHGVKRLACLRAVHITHGNFTPREDDPPLSALLPRHLVELVVTTVHAPRENPKNNALVKDIHHLSCLQRLHMSVGLQYISDKVGELINLTYLNLSNNNLRCLPSLKRLTKLEVMNISHNKNLCCELDITCTKLTKLNISSCDFDHRVLDDIRACKTLCQVTMFGNKRLTSL